MAQVPCGSRVDLITTVLDARHLVVLAVVARQDLAVVAVLVVLAADDAEEGCS